jgi:hypothetical protein
MTDSQGGEAAVVETTAGASEAPVSSERDYEAEAREQGWRPKEEWTGKPENWKDAKTFAEWGDTNKRLSKIEERIEREVADRVAKIEKVHIKTVERLTKIHNDEITNLKAQKTEAVKAGNVKLVEAIDAEIDKRKDDAPLSADTKDDQTAAEEAFAKDNPWYGKNKRMTAFAKGISLELQQDNPNMSFGDNLKGVIKAVFEEFPDYFEKKAAANAHAAVDGGSDSPGGAPSKSPLFAKLPPEAKAQCAKDVKQGVYKNNEEWAAAYFS